MMLSLDGKAISLKSMKIQASMQFADEDMSGQSSATASAEKGDKPKELTITGLVPFKEQAVLAGLFELAQAKDGSERHVYTIASELAACIKIRQVKFAGRVSAVEQDGLMAWSVSFTLREVNSVPEAIEARTSKPAATTTQTDSTATAAATTQSASSSTEAPEGVVLSSYEQWMKNADDKLGGWMS